VALSLDDGGVGRDGRVVFGSHRIGIMFKKKIAICWLSSFLKTLFYGTLSY
jgi:hypothetical protein